MQKTSEGKANAGGEKMAWRERRDGIASAEYVSSTGATPPESARSLLIDYIRNGERVISADPVALTEAGRTHHRQVMTELPPDGFRLTPGEPAIATIISEEN